MARPSTIFKIRSRVSAGDARRLAKATRVALLITLACASCGCVRRTLRITTEPPNALVFLNDQEVGRSAVSRDFIWYGDYSVIIRKEGYTTLKTNWDVKRPWYQVVPIDFFAEILWPGHIHDVHKKHFVLEPQEWPSKDELIERAKEAKARAADLGA